MDVTGYAQKFIVHGLDFYDENGNICYLEVEHKKPIDVLRSFFEEKPEISKEVFLFLILYLVMMKLKKII